MMSPPVHVVAFPLFGYLEAPMHVLVKYKLGYRRESLCPLPGEHIKACRGSHFWLHVHVDAVSCDPDCSVVFI